MRQRPLHDPAPVVVRAGSACHALNCHRMSRKLLAACGACILTMNDEAAKVRRLYSGGRNSLLSQPATLSMSRGSGRSRSKHWNVCFPFPSGGSAKTRGAPQSGHVGRPAWPIMKILPLVRIFVNSKRTESFGVPQRNFIFGNL